MATRTRKRKNLTDDFVDLGDFDLDSSYLFDDFDEEIAECEIENDSGAVIFHDTEGTGEEQTENENIENENTKPNVKLKEFTCELCSKQYKTLTGLSKHRKNVHTEDLAMKTVENEKSGDDMLDNPAWQSISVTLCSVLQSMINNPHFNAGESVHGVIMVAVACSMLENCDKFTELLILLKDRYKTEFCKTANLNSWMKGGVREDIFRNLDLIRCDSVFRTSVQEIISKTVSLDGKQLLFLPVFISCFIRQFSMEILKSVFVNKKKQMDSATEVTMSDNDQKVLYLIAGFILFSLKKKSQRLKKGNQAIISTLSELQRKNSTSQKCYVEKHSDWLGKVNRGRLIYPADDFYLMVREMEMLMRKKTDENKLSSESLIKSLMTQEIMSSYMVHYYWEGLCTESDAVTRSFVLEKVTDLFLTVRGFAIARRVKARYETENKSNKGEKSLRTVLKEKSNNF